MWISSCPFKLEPFPLFYMGYGTILSFYFEGNICDQGASEISFYGIYNTQILVELFIAMSFSFSSIHAVIKFSAKS